MPSRSSKSGMAAEAAGAARAGKGRGFRGWAARSFERALDGNLANVRELVATAPPGCVFLDLGCDDGRLTMDLAHAAGAATVHGLELVPERVRLARRLGVDARCGDLNGAFPYANESFDVVCSHQVIEHLADTDMFVREIHRVLRPGGLAVTSTENLASWHNVAALLFGWQPFSLTNVSSVVRGLGNPLAVHRGELDARDSWQHVRVFAYAGLRELFERHGFRIETIRGAGYYPLPAAAGRRDARHAAFLTVAARRGGA